MENDFTRDWPSSHCQFLESSLGEVQSALEDDDLHHTVLRTCCISARSIVNLWGVGKKFILCTSIASVYFIIASRL